MNGGFMFRKQRVYACLLFLLLAGTAGVSFAAPSATSYEGSGSILQTTIENYQKLEPKLTAAQREEFKEAFEGICTTYQTAGILLSSVMDAADEVSGRTAMASYQRIMGELPRMINRLARLVQSFK
jgi:hypothetical protein